MGEIQKAVNNLLIGAGIAAGATSGAIKAEQKAKAEIPKEEEEIKATQEKLEDASKMAIGYTEQQVRAKRAEEALGDIIGEPYNKKPRGVGQKTFDRRTANAETMKVIFQKAAQDKAFRERISKFSTSDIARAIKPTIDKKGGKK